MVQSLGNWVLLCTNRKGQYYFRRLSSDHDLGDSSGAPVTAAHELLCDAKNEAVSWLKNRYSSLRSLEIDTDGPFADGNSLPADPDDNFVVPTSATGKAGSYRFGGRVIRSPKGLEG